MKRSFFSFVLLCAIIFSSSCTMYPVKLSLYGSSVLNNDKRYHSLPVEVAIFQLRGKDRFNRTSFFNLWQSPKKSLGADFVSQKHVMLSPGTHKTITLSRQKNAKYLGVMPIFKNPGALHSRVVMDISKIMPLIPKRITISIVDNRVYIR